MLNEHSSDTRFVLEPGSYHFWGENALRKYFAVSNSDQAEELSIAVLLENMSHVEIDGQGAEFLVHGDLCPVVVTDCKEVRLKDFSIDFPIPSSAEAKILHAKDHAVEVYLNHRQYPYHVTEGGLIFEREYGQEASLFAAMEFDSETGRIPKGMGDTFPRVRAQEIKEDVIRLEGEFSVVPKEGNLLVLRHGKRVHPGMLLQHSQDILMDGITFYQTCGLGAVFQFCQDIRVNRAAFRANEKRGRRILSGHDDGLHFSNNKGEILVENCYFHGLMDDPINVHGTAACLVKREGGRKLRGAFRHHQSKGFSRWADKGDEISFINPANRMDCARGVVKEYRLVSEEEFELVLETDIPSEIQEGFALENLTNTPAVTIRKNWHLFRRAD